MDRASFVSLPPELRTEIYKLVLIQPRDIQLIDRQGKVICANTFDGGRRHHILAITRVCKIIRQESLPVFFGLNSFFLNTQPDLTAIGSRWVRDYLNGLNELDNVKRWLRCMGKSTLPVAIDVQEKWWIAAGRGTRLLRDAGISSACDVRVHLHIEHYPTYDLIWCDERGPSTAIHQSFTLSLPTGSRAAAMSEVERTILAQRDMLEKHLRDCLCRLGDDEILFEALLDLTFSYYMLMRAFGMGVEDFLVRVEGFWRNWLGAEETVFPYLRENARAGRVSEMDDDGTNADSGNWR